MNTPKNSYDSLHQVHATFVTKSYWSDYERETRYVQ